MKARLECNSMKKLICLVILFASAQLRADVRHYSASIESSVWSIAAPNRLQCQLIHQLPGYGKAVFTSVASKQLNMDFTLEMMRLPKERRVAAVYSVPPQWMPGEMHRTIADMSMHKQFDGHLPEQAAWTMLSELEKGYWPTIHYSDWYSRFDSVSVALNAANFSFPYQSFVNCVTNLLPFSFEDIAYTVLTYEKNSVDLTKSSKKKLDMIGRYLVEDTDLELILLDGYTDSYGGKYSNQQLSIKRAGEIKTFFEEMGVKADRIAITGHGERRHVAPNNDSFNRAKNRRVVIRMQKP